MHPTVNVVLYHTDHEAEAAMSFQQLPQWRSPPMVLTSPQEMQVKGQHELVPTSRVHLKISWKYDFSEAISSMWSSQIQIKFKPLHCMHGLPCHSPLLSWLIQQKVTSTWCHTRRGWGNLSGFKMLKTASLFFLWNIVLKSISKRQRVCIFSHLCFIPSILIYKGMCVYLVAE